METFENTETIRRPACYPPHLKSSIVPGEGRVLTQGRAWSMHNAPLRDQREDDQECAGSDDQPRDDEALPLGSPPLGVRDGRSVRPDEDFRL